MMKKQWVFALAFWAFFIPAVSAESLRVATDENLPPYSFLQGGVAAGIDVDMLLEAASQVQIEITVVALPWQRVLHYVKSGEMPLAMPLFKTAEREGFAAFIAPVHYSMTGAFILASAPLKFDLTSDLYGKHIGYNRGFALPERLEVAIKEGKIVAEEVSTTEQNISRLRAKRIDLFVANVLNTQFILQGTPGQNEIRQLPKLLSARRPAYLVVSKAAHFDDKDKIVSSLTLALERLHRDGSYDRIVNKYTH